MTPLISYMARARETGFQCEAMQNYKLVAKMLSSYICHSSTNQGVTQEYLDYRRGAGPQKN